MKVSEHAIDRYIERVAPVERPKAKAKLLAIAKNGHKSWIVVVNKDAILTIMPRDKCLRKPPTWHRRRKRQQPGYKKL